MISLFKVTNRRFGRYKFAQIHTPRKTNMSPENQWLEDVFPTKIVPFWGHVSFQGCRKEHDLNQTSMSMFMLICRDVVSLPTCWTMVSELRVKGDGLRNFAKTP